MDTPNYRGPRTVTGYTYKLVEEGQSFKDFLLTCARAFGALVELRDEPLSSEIPAFEVGDYYPNQIKTLTEEVKELEGYTLEQQVAFGKDKIAKEKEYHTNALAKQKEQTQRLIEMEARVKEWIPPSSDHTSLKGFMLEQLQTSRIDWDYHEKKLARTELLVPQERFAEELAVKTKRLANAKQSLKEEEDRVAGRNKWVQLLKDSVPQ